MLSLCFRFYLNVKLWLLGFGNSSNVKLSPRDVNKILNSPNFFVGKSTYWNFGRFWSNMKTVQKKRMEHFDYTNLINKILFIYAVPVEWLPGKHKSNILVGTANSCFTNYLRELDERLQSMVETIFLLWMSLRLILR